MHCQLHHALCRHDHHPHPRTSTALPPLPSRQFAPGDLHNEQCLGHVPGGEDETKYIQQGAKPKKKRRAPAPPTPQPGRAAQPPEPETSCSGTQEQPQSSGEQENGTILPSAECYVEQSRTSPAESEATSVESATEVMQLVASEETRAVTSEECSGEEAASEVASQDVTVEKDVSEASAAGTGESVESIVVQETIASQDVTVEKDVSEASAAGTGESVESIVVEETIASQDFTVEKDISVASTAGTGESVVEETISEGSPLRDEHPVDAIVVEQTFSVVTIADQSQNSSEPTETVHQYGFDSSEDAEKEDLAVESPLHDNTSEPVEDISPSCEIPQNSPEESPLTAENTNALTDVKNENDLEESHTDSPLQNGFSGSDSESSPHLIDEESKPLPKPRTILPEKPTEQDKKP